MDSIQISLNCFLLFEGKMKTLMVYGFDVRVAHVNEALYPLYALQI